MASPNELGPAHLFKRTSEVEYRSYDQLYPKCDRNVLIVGKGPTGNIDLHHEWNNAERFIHNEKSMEHDLRFDAKEHA